MQANNSKQHVNLRQYINDFKKVFTSGMHRSHFQPLLLFALGGECHRICLDFSIAISFLLWLLL